MIQKNRLADIQKNTIDVSKKKPKNKAKDDSYTAFTKGNGVQYKYWTACDDSTVEYPSEDDSSRN